LKKIIILISLIIIFSFSPAAQLLRSALSPGYAGLGAYSTKQVDALSVSTNQAALAQLKNTSAGAYTQRHYLINELNSYTAMIGVITRSGTIGLKTVYTGSTDFNETQIGVAYGRKLGSKVDIGVQFNYNSIRISSGYGKDAAINFEGGIIMHVSERLNVGFHTTNPVGGKFGADKQEQLPSVYTMGLGYDASDKLYVSAAIEKEEGQFININAGFQYRLIKQLLVRMGISAATGTGWLGIGFLFHSFRVDVTTSYHPQLGITPGILLLVDFKKSNK
jgi:hypothetical protein